MTDPDLDGPGERPRWQPVPPTADDDPDVDVPRVGAGLYYDRSIVGVSGASRRRHRGMPPGRFYPAEDPFHAPHFMLRAARNPWAFAGLFFGFGFFAVFVRQASLLIQIILGAPIFEEMLKFGFALLLGLAVTFVLAGFRMTSWRAPAWTWVRLPIAWAVGAGFGVLEHVTTYPSEDASSYMWRVLFHGLSTGASMVAYQAALASGDERTRWFAVVPSVAIHYLNNYGAILLGFGSILVAELGILAQFMSSVLVVTLALASFAMLVLPAQTRAGLEALVAKLPSETARAE